MIYSGKEALEKYGTRYKDLFDFYYLNNYDKLDRKI